MRRAARPIVVAYLAAVACGGADAATTCLTTAATVSNYTASTTFAAARIEYADCSAKVVRVVTASDGTTQLDLSNKQAVNVKSLPSIMQLNLKNNNISRLEKVSIPSTIQTLDLSTNMFTSFQNFIFPNSLKKLTSSNGKLATLYNMSFPDSVTTLSLSNNPIALISGVVFPSSLKVLSIISTVNLAEFEIRHTDAIRLANLQTFNVSMTTSLTCSDNNALNRYVQDTLLCVLADDFFNSKYGIKSDSSASGSVDVVAPTLAPELQEANNPRRSKFLLFATVSLSLACVGLMSTLAPRTLYERYQKKKYMKLRSKKQQQQQQQQQAPLEVTPPQQTNEQLRDPNTTYWDL